MTTTQRLLDRRTRLSVAGQGDLGWWVDEAYGIKLWSIQRQILDALSMPRAVVTAPSCFSSGKTFLAGHTVWAFLDAYRPGVPCKWCYVEHGSPGCLGSKVVMTSSTKEHLLTVPWVEVQKARERLSKRGFHDLPMLYPKAAKTQTTADHPDWFAIGLNPNEADAISGFHAPHVLVIGEEATAIPPETVEGLNSLLASGDARLFLIYNPKDADVWAEDVGRDPNATRIRITAYDTPHFTGEAVPFGATLITQDYLHDLISRGQGPGTYMWQTKVEATAWSAGERTLIPKDRYDRAVERAGKVRRVGTKAMGVDLARYGDAENVIAVRHGQVVTHVEGHRAMNQRTFWRGPVLDALRKHRPSVMTYDADGLGAGVGESIATIERILKDENITCEVLGFRGGLGAGSDYLNQRSMHWWQLAERFQNNAIAIVPSDPDLRAQLTTIQYGFNSKGKIQVETKEALRKRDLPSPDRGDAVMYSFAFDAAAMSTPSEELDVVDHSDEAMWKRRMEELDNGTRRNGGRLIDPVTHEEW